jgi:hypothetical protein
MWGLPKGPGKSPGILGHLASGCADGMCYSPACMRVCREDLQPDSGFLRELCYFADPCSPADTQLLASACALLLSSRLQPASDAQQQQQQQPQQQAAQQQPLLLEFCSRGGPSGEARAALAQRAQRLAALGLRALAVHADEPAIRAQLAAPRQGLAAACVAGRGNVAGLLVEGVLALAGAVGCGQAHYASWAASYETCLS